MIRTRGCFLVYVGFSDGTKAEVDLFGIHRGEIVAGEAKTSPAEFVPDQLSRDVELSRRLGANIHLLVSPNGIDQAQVSETLRLVQAAGLRLIVIEAAEAREVG